MLVVAPAALLHPAVPQPDGTLLYELVTGHPDRAARELVFVADLTVELRAWPTDTWAKVGIDPQAAASAVIAAWRRGDLTGLRLGRLEWVPKLGEVEAFGVEGCGCDGAGLARFLGAQGQLVLEVNRPDRSARRPLGL